MIATLKILWTSLKMALGELRVNKLRTFLSLLGITIGIFCIIAVFTLTNSLERNIRKDLNELGNDVIYVQKWPWGGGGDYPWWKYMNRPEPQFKDFRIIEDKVKTAAYSSFNFESSGKKVEYGNDYMEGVSMTAVSNDFDQIQQLQILNGRFFANNECNSGTNVCILGANIWDGLFGSAEMAIGKTVKVSGHETRVVGALKKKGESMVGGLSLDNSVLLPYRYARTLVDERRFADPYIMVKARANVPIDQLKDDLRGVMRAAHRLRPGEEDDFALNEISSASKNLEGIFSAINLGGGFIAIFALIVGAFGIANIMFVTVKERTSIIGLKKAIGARRGVILMEFLMEAVCLCLVGGTLGLLLVYIITLIINAASTFQVVLTLANIIRGLTISAVVGVLAGFIPAYSASKLDPVVAIRGN